MKRHLAWWVILGLLLVAWVPFGVEELINKILGRTHYPDSEVAIWFGFWLFVWWPCHIAVLLILLYKGIRWFVGRLRTQNSN